MNVDSTDMMKRNGTKKMKSYDWFFEPQFYLIGGLYAASRIYMTIGKSYVSLYVHYYLRLPDEYIAIIPFITILTGFVTSGPTKYLTNKVGVNITYVLSCILGLGTLSPIQYSNTYIKIPIFIINAS